jgi:ferritin-like metal-binding protein YciE
MKLDTLEKLFIDQLKDLYSAEKQILQALPRMAKAATSDELRAAFEEHIAVTEKQKERLDKISEMLGQKLTGKKCHAMEGLIEEGKEVLDADGPGAIIDAALIAAAQRVEHYEISGYGTARTLAEKLGLGDAVRLLDETAKEEGEADHKLTQLAEQAVYPVVDEDDLSAANGRSNSKSKAKSR